MFSQSCLLWPGMDACTPGAQIGAVLRLEGMGWAAEFSVSAGCLGKGKLTFVKSPASAYLISPPEQPYGVGVTSLVWLKKL